MEISRFATNEHKAAHLLATQELSRNSGPWILNSVCVHLLYKLETLSLNSLPLKFSSNEWVCHSDRYYVNTEIPSFLEK